MRRRWRRAGLLRVSAAVVALAAPAPADAASIGGAGAGDAPARFAPRLDGPTPVAGEVVLRGELRTSLDGSRFDALTQLDGSPPFMREGDLDDAGGRRPGGLFDPAAGGLRVVEQDPDGHVYRLALDADTRAPGCAAAGVRAPCLVPRLAELAHERLTTAAELAPTLGGRMEAEALQPPALSPGGARGVAAGLVALWMAGAALVLRAVRRARRASALGQVRVAAAEARRAVRGEPALARVREQVEGLVERAGGLERVRAACAARLARIDPVRLEARRAAWERVRGSAPDAPAALAALDKEAAEARQLGADLSSAVAGLDRIASSLRALALRARADRGTRAVGAGDPVEAMFAELDLRDAAAGEAQQALAAPETSPQRAS